MTKQIVKVGQQIFISNLHNTPNHISNIYYDMVSKGKCKTPRKASVLKVFKENLRYFGGYDYTSYTKEQQQELLRIAEDTYEGIREAEEYN